MQGNEIHDFIKLFPALNKHFVGVFAINSVPKRLNYRQFCVCNTDVDQGPGIHWFCFVKNSKKNN